MSTFASLQVRFPKTISQEARDLLKGLLHKDPNKRLGGGPGDVKEVQSHPFYITINWKLLEEKKVRDSTFVWLPSDNSGSTYS